MGFIKLKITKLFLLTFCLCGSGFLFADLVVSIDQPDYHITNHDEIELSVNIAGVGTEMRGYQIDFSFDPEYLEISGTADFREGGFLNESGRTQFYVTGADGNYQVACAILGLTFGSVGSGTLFTVSLHAIRSTDELGTDVLLSNVILRDPLNNEILEDRVEGSNVVIDPILMYCRIKAFLHGPYLAGGSMRHIILNYIPLTSPYNTAESVTALPEVSPNYIVDWVLIQLRATYNGPVLHSQSGFILSDGSVVDKEGNPNLSFEYTDLLSHYIVLRHRNHLGVMSAVAHELTLDSGSSSLVNLTQLGSVYGGDVLGARQVETGVLALYTGDSNSDGRVNNIDWVAFWRVQNGSSGYIQSDYDLSGVVNNVDWVLYWRINNGRISQIP
jgi:hypothetical protein